MYLAIDLPHAARWLVVLCLAMPCVPTLAAQEQSPTPSAAATDAPAASNIDHPASSGPARTTVVSDETADYRIGARDVLDVKVEDAPELSRSYEVTAAGTLNVPFAGVVTALGKTPEELALEIAEKLRGSYLKNPIVVVTMRQFVSRVILIQGAVKSPGSYQIEGSPSLVRLLAVAGGLNDNHGSKAFVLRAKVEVPGSGAPSGDRDFDIITVSLAGLYRGDDLANVRLRPGDIVHVPPADLFYVAGEVRAPGSFSLKDGTTLRQAISLAQGTTSHAASSRGIIFRDDPRTGKRTSLNVDISKVMRGDADDIAIEANDIVVVPNSRAKTVGNAILSALGFNALRVPLPY